MMAAEQTRYVGEFEHEQQMLERWGEEYERLHGAGYPSQTVEGRLVSGETGVASVPGARILSPNVSRSAWQTEKRIAAMARTHPVMARVLRLRYGYRMTWEVIAQETRLPQLKVRTLVEAGPAWLAGFESGLRG